ncbi:MAG: hypothetical protein ABL933_08780 [Methyloglobulus sp.]|nr:hypothetical protein [Methyloglobulus sp.]
MQKMALNGKSLFDKALFQCLNSAATKNSSTQKTKKQYRNFKREENGVWFTPIVANDDGGQLSAKDKRVNETPLTIGIDQGTTCSLLIYAILFVWIGYGLFSKM